LQTAPRIRGLDALRQKERLIMKTSTLFLCALLTMTADALADGPTAQGNASATSDTSVSANRSGATATEISAAAASAGTRHSQANTAGASEMNATLSKPVDARNAKPGDTVTATSDRDAEASDGTHIKRGSKLVGHVTQARPLDKSASGSAEAGSMLSIVFDKAILRDGREVPLNATIQAVSAAQSAASLDSGMGGGGMSAGGFGAGSARGGGGGLVRGAGGAVAGGLGAAGSLAGGAGSGVSGAVGGAAGVASHSAGAVGGLNASGMLTSGSQGVFGIQGLELASSSFGSAEGSVITSSTRNVHLDGGTQMLLSNRAGGGSAMTSGAAEAAGSVTRSGATKDASGSSGAPSQPPRHSEDRR
jgi:hypothetical protein